MSAWNSAPIAAPWRQGLCGAITTVVVFGAVCLPTPVARPESAPVEMQMPRMPSPMVAFSVVRLEKPVDTKHDRGTDAADVHPVTTPSSFHMADGDAFPLIISIPAGPAWRDVFRRYGGAIGVSTSSSPRPAYLNHTISPDGRLDEESVPTIGRFLFKLSDEAIRVVNETVDPTAQIPPGESAFGVFAGQFRSVVARVLQEFCTTEHVNPDDLTGVQLELGPGFGLRVASTTRRARKF